MSKKTIYIAGLGLIGGSLALGIKRDHPDYEILGYNRSDYSRNIALERGIVDRATSDFKEFAPLADVIILAVPIKQTVAYLKELADLELIPRRVCPRRMRQGWRGTRLKSVRPFVHSFRSQSCAA